MGEMSWSGRQGVTVPAAARAMSDPGAIGRLGTYGGRYVPESLIPACHEIEGGIP